jgi:anti-sigma regulatory factor (Ser/Thr protein kinase)
MKICLSSLFTALLVCCATFLCSQSVHYKHLTKEEGMASDVVYYTLQDSKGYVWICTQAMISRFDGQNFKHFDESKGLQLRAVFCAAEDHDERMWFASYGRELYFVEGDTILPYRFNDSLSKYLDVAAAFHSLKIDKDNTVYLGTPYDGMIAIDSSGNVTNDFEITPNSPVRLDIWEVEKDLLSATQFAEGAGRDLEIAPSQSDVKESDVIEVRWRGMDGEKSSYNCSLGNNWNHQRQFYQCRFDEDVVLSYDRLLMKGIQSNDPDTMLLDGLIISMAQAGENLLVGTYGNGIQSFDSGLSQTEHKYGFLDGKSVANIMVDHQGGIWFSMLGEGIFYVPNQEIEHLYNEDIIWTIEQDVDAVSFVAGSKTGNVYEKKEERWIVSDPQLGPITQISSLEKGTVIRGSSGIEVQGYENLNISKWHTVLADVVEWNEEVLGLSSLGVVDFQRDNLLVFPTDVKTGRFADAVLTEDEIYLLRTRELFKFNGNDFAPIKIPEPYGSSGFQCMAMNGSELAIGTTKRGVWMLSFVGDSLHFEQRLTEEICEQVKFLDDHTLIVGTTDGISCYQKEGEWVKISQYSRAQGLSSSMVYDFLESRDTLWVATAKGLNYMSLDVFRQSDAPPLVQMDGVLLNGETTIVNGGSLDYADNSIEIKYSGISYRAGKNLRFKYRLNESEGGWVETDQRTINYSSLPPGSYRFEVLCVDALGKHQEVPAIFEFSILPLFWQTTWFLVICVLVSLLIIGLIYRFNIRRIKLRLHKEQQFVFYQQRSVAMQMNPHFLYNSLNSVVKFISTNERQQAVRYLSRFAKLMRHFLNNSKNDYVSLEEELNALELYCSLEKVRFKDRFDYAFEIHLTDDREDLGIPTLLLQPAIENAIRHGIAHLDGQGVLKLYVEQRDNTLYVRIEDNGVGREASAGYRKKLGDDSSLHSTEITRERISLLGKSMSRDLKYEIEDIVQNEVVRGTRVIFELPIIKL